MPAPVSPPGSLPAEGAGDHAAPEAPGHPPLRARLVALQAWRRGLHEDLRELTALLVAAELLGPAAQQAVQALGERLMSGRCVLAVTGATGSGKTTLANALLALEGGWPVLPALPTACPVELAWDPSEPPTMALLPMATRRQAGLISEWRGQKSKWARVALEGRLPPAQASPSSGMARQPQAGAVDAPLAHGGPLNEAARMQRVSRRQAAALGLLAVGVAPGAERVEVPAWRHALVNLPHPLLEEGLCLLDTPSLEDLSTEPELVLGQLPAADLLLVVQPGAAAPEPGGPLAAALQHPRSLYVTCAGAGRQGPDGPAFEPPHDAASQACTPSEAAGPTPLPGQRHFMVDPVQALRATALGDQGTQDMAASGLPALAAACGDTLLAWRHRQHAADVVSGVMSLMEDAQRRLREQRRSHAEQLLGMRSLRNESGGRLAQLQAQLNQEAEALDLLSSSLEGLLLAQDRALRLSLEALEASHLKAAAASLKSLLAGGLLRAPARAAGFARICQQLRAQAEEAARHCAEACATWAQARERLQRDFGLAVAELPIPDLGRLAGEIDLIERSYSRYFSLAHAVRMATAEAADPLRRMLTAKLKLLLSGARQQLVAWQQALNPSVREPLAQRRAQLERRAQGLARIEQAADELDQHVAQLEARDEALLATLDQARRCAARLRQRAEQGPLAARQAFSPSPPPPVSPPIPTPLSE